MDSPMDTSNLSRVRVDCPKELCPHGAHCFSEFHLDFSPMRRSYSICNGSFLGTFHFKYMTLEAGFFV